MLSLQELATAFLGFLRIKVSAIFLEPFGVGILSQLTIFQNFLSQFVQLGIVGGITKYTAEFHSNNDKQSIEKLIGTVIFIFLIAGILVSLICVAFQYKLSNLLFADYSYGLFIILIGLAIPITAQVEVISRFLQGMLKIREMVIFGIACSFVGAIITIALTVSFGLKGAIISILLTAISSVIIGYWYLKYTVLKDHNVNFRLTFPDKSICKKLSRFGGANIIMVVLNALTLLAISTVIISALGAKSNGFYHVSLIFSNRYLGLIFIAVWRYWLPKVAMIREDYETTAQMQNDVLRLMLLSIAPLIVILLVFKEFWISLLYTVDFLDAASLMSWQLTGDLFRAVGWAANFTLLVNERFKFLIFLTLFFSSVRFGTFWFLLPNMGIQAAPISYAVAHGLLAPLILIGNYGYNRFSISKQNWVLIAKSFGILILTITLISLKDLNSLFFYMIPLAALGIFLITSIQMNEFQNVLKIFGSIIKPQNINS